MNHHDGEENDTLTMHPPNENMTHPPPSSSSFFGGENGGKIASKIGIRRHTTTTTTTMKKHPSKKQSKHSKKRSRSRSSSLSPPPHRSANGGESSSPEAESSSSPEAERSSFSSTDVHSNSHKRRKSCSEEEKRRAEDATPTRPPSAAASEQSEEPSESSSSSSNAKSTIDCLVDYMDEHRCDLEVQLQCLKCLPSVLQDETHRRSAHHNGLVALLLHGLVTFPDHAKLHIRTFRALVVLLRPLGGCQEGMLLCTDGTHDDLIQSVKLSKGCGMKKHGIDVILDSMRRFAADASLQAAAAWAMVNVALHPKRRSIVIKRGGVFALTNAMMLHPHDENVQFRALFALINLVIPSPNHKGDKSNKHQQSSNEDSDSSKYSTLRRILDPHIYQIARLSVLAVQHFPHHKAILNRACLVLKNISLTEDYQKILVHTPHCSETLQWCHKTCAGYDKILAKSIRGTLQRLQLSNAHDVLKMRFLTAAAMTSSSAPTSSASRSGASSGSDSGTDTTSVSLSSRSMASVRNGGGGSTTSSMVATAPPQTSASSSAPSLNESAVQNMSDEIKRVRSIRFGCPM